MKDEDFMVRYRQKHRGDGQRVRAEALFDAKPAQFLVPGEVCPTCMTFTASTENNGTCRRCGKPIPTCLSMYSQTNKGKRHD